MPSTPPAIDPHSPGEARLHALHFSAGNSSPEADEARLRLAAIVESSTDAIVSKDLNGIVTSWNLSAEKMFGYAAAEIIGRPITVIIPPELQDDEPRILETLRRGDRIEHFQTVRITRDGRRLHVSLTISPVRNDDGRVIGAAKIIRDITQQKQMEETLRTAEKLAIAGRMAATVAHEVNNPLESIMNLIYLARNHDDAPQAVREYLTVAEHELGRLAHITRQTLGFYREQRKTAPLHVGACLRRLIPVLTGTSASRGILIDLDVREDPEIQALVGEIEQVVSNILTNSLRAVQTGGHIRVRVSAAREEKTRRPAVRFTIFDSGPGIPYANRARIFEPFFTTRSDVGTGLGLWICRTILDRHSGRIAIRSSTTPGNSWTAVSCLVPVDGAIAREEASGSTPQTLAETIRRITPETHTGAPSAQPSPARSAGEIAMKVHIVEPVRIRE